MSDAEPTGNLGLKGPAHVRRRGACQDLTTVASPWWGLMKVIHHVEVAGGRGGWGIQLGRTLLLAVGYLTTAPGPLLPHSAASVPWVQSKHVFSAKAPLRKQSLCNRQREGRGGSGNGDVGTWA